MKKKEFYEVRAQTYANFDKQGHLRYQRALSLVELADKSSVLDIGCKKAHLLDILQEKNIHCSYDGIDISESVIENLKEKKGSFHQHDIMQKMPFGDGSFDFIFCLEVVEHVENPTYVLSEFHRVLKKDGTLLLSVPNVYNWIAFASDILKLPAREGHIHSFTFRDMRTLLDFSGFKIEKRIGTYGFLPYTIHGIRDSHYLMFKTNCICLSTSHIYKITKK